MRNNTITETRDGFVRELTIVPPFDKRSNDPGRNYGIHGMEFRFVLSKDNRATQFVAYTQLHLPHVARELHEQPKSRYLNPMEIQGADVGYHSPTPTYEGQTCTDEACQVTGGKCYYDGSSLRAEEWAKRWLEDGTDMIWMLLREQYERTFATQTLDGRA